MAERSSGATGLRVLVTRPAAEAVEWAAALSARGLDAQPLPLIDIQPADDPAPVQAAWAALAHTDLVFFVSPNAVRQFFARRPPGMGWPPATRAASPGPGTSRALQQAGVPEAQRVAPPVDAAQFDSEALWAVLRHEAWAGRRVMVVRGEGGRDWLAGHWRAAGASVDFVTAYRRARAVPGAGQAALLREALARPDRHLWFFSSSEAVDHLLALAGEPAAAEGGAVPPWRAATALATHPRIAARATAAGFGRVLACRPTLDAVAACIESHAPPGADGA